MRVESDLRIVVGVKNINAGGSNSKATGPNATESNDPKKTKAVSERVRETLKLQTV